MLSILASLASEICYTSYVNKETLIIISILIIVGIIFFVIKFAEIKNTIIVIQKTSNAISTPFDGITIPYLRKREYKSTLGQLDEIDHNSSYTSYLTSYTSDGLKINALLTKPTGVMPKGGFPAIVFVHGYIPPAEYRTLERYVDYVDYLAKNGFVVFKIDLRGNGSSEGKPGGGYFGADYVIDTLNAYASLESSNFVNKKEIGLWGHSMAGNTVLRSMAVKPTIPAVDIWAGAVYTYIDQREYGINDQSYQPLQTPSTTRNSRQEMFAKVGTPSAGNKFWELVAPTSYLNDLKGAIQINHAIDDTVVDIRYSENLNMLLDKTSVPHEFYKYPTGGHNISGVSFTLSMQRTVEFFNKYLKNK